MNTSPAPTSHVRRRFLFGIVALLASSAIAILISTGAAEPYPNLKFAYLLCVAVGVFGLVQLIVAVAGMKQSGR